MEFLRDVLDDYSLNEECVFGTTEDIAVFFRKLNETGYAFSKRTSKNNPGPLGFKLRGVLPIECLNMPFQKLKTESYHCGNGPKYYKTKKDKKPVILSLNDVADQPTGKKERLRLGSKKMNCPAKLTILHIRTFPNYKLKKNTWRERSKILSALKRDLFSNAVAVLSQEKYYILLSLHHNHPITTLSHHRRLDARLRNEIKRVVQLGNTNVVSIQQLLKNFVTQHDVHPEKWSKAMDTSEKLIYNYILKFIFEKHKIAFDQKALELRTEEFTDNGNANVFFRPYSFVAKNNEAESFLFCYQSNWQKELLKRYGDVCLLDATYKTIEYNVPLFMLIVKTNVNYSVVGVFIVQHDNANAITEALNVFKMWNSQWSPKFCMVDFLETENAIKSTFDCSTYICSFHREQAWRRWLNENCSKDMPEILKLWQTVADSVCEEDFEKNSKMLQENSIFQDNKDAFDYYLTSWMPHYRKWVLAFFHPDFEFIISTNNGIEMQNLLLKHSNFRTRADESSTHVLDVIINSFLPEALRTYLEDNGKLSPVIEVYDAVIPTFLYGKPEFFIKHVYQRYCSAKSVYSKNSILKLSSYVYSVKSETNSEKYYTVSFQKPSCSCADFMKYRFPCKHLCALMLYVPQCSFDRLPESYRCSPYLTTDNQFNRLQLDNLENHLNHEVVIGEGEYFTSIEVDHQNEEETAVSSMKELDQTTIMKDIEQIRELACFVRDNSYNFRAPFSVEDNDALQNILCLLTQAKNLTKELVETESEIVSVLPVPIETKVLSNTTNKFTFTQNEKECKGTSFNILVFSENYSSVRLPNVMSS